MPEAPPDAASPTPPSARDGPLAVPPRRRVFVSLTIRLTVPVVLLVVAMAALVYAGIVRQSRTTLLDSKRAAAVMVGRLTAVSVMPAVVFGDTEEMQRALDDLARNPDVTNVELCSTAEGSDGKPLASVQRNSRGRLGCPKTARSESTVDLDAVRLVEPVVSNEGKPIAVIVARFTTQPEVSALARLSRRISYLSTAAALLLAAAIMWVIVRVVVRPVKHLQEAARRLTRGEGAALERARVRIEDELSHLAERFGEMVAAVRDREARLAVRNRELKLILDSVKQGFMTAMPDGRLLQERSAIIEQWTGPLPANPPLSVVLGRIDPTEEAWAQAAWAQIADAILPLEVALDQMPKRLARDGRYFDVAYHPVLADGTLECLVVVLTDVTAEVDRQRTEAEQQEFSVLVDQLARDRRSFLDAWGEAARLVSDVLAGEGEPGASLRRSLHTLKGNARSLGLNRLAALCHSLEDAIRDRGEPRLEQAEREQLMSLWATLNRRMAPIFQGAAGFLDVSREEYEALMQAVRRHDTFESIEERLNALRREPVAARFQRAKALIEATCAKLGKTTPHVSMEHGDIRLPAGSWAGFWSVFSHIVTNAADHGVESDEQRKRAKKPVPATIELKASLGDGEFAVEVRDDGPGVDWADVAARARALGLPHGSRAELVDALMTDGFSLKGEVSELSGRGVGLAAVRVAVSEFGGVTEVESDPRRGTTWRFRFRVRDDLPLVPAPQPQPEVVQGLALPN